ncbi:MAG: methyltransferase domain-containing protein [Dermatophilaceae bacterium]
MSPDEEMPSLQSFTPRMFSRPRDEGATPEAVSMQVRILDHQDNAAGIIRLREWALTKASPHEGHVVVDVGSGAGTMCARFAGLVGPTGAVTGVEPNPSLRTVAHERLAWTGASVVDGTAEQLPFGDASVDFLWCERVLQHVPDSEAAVREFHRVLRPGGHAIILDSDHLTQRISDIDDDIHHLLLTRMLPLSFANPAAARHLPAQLAHAGLQLDPDIGASALVLLGREVLEWPMAPRAIAAARQEGVLTDEQADRALASLTAAAERQTAFTSVSIFGFVAAKPA